MPPSRDDWLPMRGMILLVLLAAPSAVALDEVDDAYRVSAVHDEYGALSGFLQVGQGIGGELWLEGANVLFFHRSFTFLCTSEIVADALVVERCHGPQNARFVGGYAIDATGAATGAAFGEALLPQLLVSASSHT